MAVIMAGGRGERLWPLSTPGRPKQFLALGGKRSLLQETAARIGRLVPPERTYVVVPSRFTHLIREQLAIPEENILVEPMGRNTAPCLGLAATVLAAQDPQAVMIALPSDHMIRDVEEFCSILQVAIRVAQEGKHLVTLGIVPDRPATGYGYIRRGKLFARQGEIEVDQARAFVEKPDRATAERLFTSGEYLWNSGMFIWRVDAILAAIARHLPELCAGLSELQAHLGQLDWETVLEQVYQNLPSISIDYGVMERASNVLVIPADIGWSDVGDWASFGAVIPADPQGNVVHARHLGIDTKGCVIYAEDPARLVATIGLEDVVIVEGEAGLLVMRKDRAQEVRKVLELLREGGQAGNRDGGA